MTERIGSYEEFWPHYLSEHRDARSRRLHFLGTSGWLASLAASAAARPVAFPAALAAMGAIINHGVKKGEADKPSFAHVAAAVAIPAAVSPVLFPAGVVFAYGCAWVGHFGIEKNRPATFEYPLWSLYSDFRMYGHMLRGRLWKGDPLEELGLDDPTENEEPVQTHTGPEVHA